MMDETTQSVIDQASTDYRKQASMLLGQNAILKTSAESQEVTIQEQQRVINYLEKKVRELETRLERAERSPA